MRDYTEFFKQGVADLYTILKDSLLVRAVHVELASCEYGEKAEEVRARMEKHTFDIMGYKVGNKVNGYVCQKDLKSGTCDAYQKPLQPTDTISACSSILVMLSRMKNRRWLFTAAKDDVIGIVTMADLQKAPVRMALFGLVSLLEIHTSSMVRTCYPCDTDIERGLGPCDQLNAAKRYQKTMLARNENLDLTACLFLPEKTRLLFDRRGVPGFLGFRSFGDAKEVFGRVTELRNNLAHGRDILRGFRKAGQARRACVQAAGLSNKLAHYRSIVEGNVWTKPIEVLEKIRDVLDHYETNREEFERQFGRDKRNA